MTSNNYVYQQLTVDDVADVKALLKVFGEAFGDSDTYQNAAPEDEYIQFLLTKPHIIVMVAKDDKEVVGGIVAYELEKFEQDRREIYIYDLAVAEKYRRQGIATSLINELKTVAHTRNAYVLFVQADKSDEPAIHLYESFGTKEEVYQFDINV